MNSKTLNQGIITQIIGPVMDIAFSQGKMPNIYNAVIIEGVNEAGQVLRITAEVQQLLGDQKVRAIALNQTDGLQRGMKVLDTGAPLSVPVGSTILGRIFNVLGEPVDNMGPVKVEKTLPIHRLAPAFVNLDTKLSIFETGVAVRANILNPAYPFYSIYSIILQYAYFPVAL